MNINAITIEAKEGLFEGNIKIYVHDKEELDELSGHRLKQFNGIHTVDRFDSRKCLNHLKKSIRSSISFLLFLLRFQISKLQIIHG